MSTQGNKIAALAILLVLIAVFLFAAAFPIWRSYQSLYSEIAGVQERLDRAVAANENAKSTLARSESLGELERFLLVGESTTHAAALLQSRIGDLVARYGGQLTSTQAIPAESGQSIAHLSVRAHFMATAESLVRILMDLEGQLPLLVMEELRVSSRGGRNLYENTLLDVSFRVSGWMAKSQ